VRPLTQAVALAEQVAGELHVAIAHGRSDEIGQLFDALSHMTGRLADTVGRVRDGAVAIDSASREIATGNMDLSRAPSIRQARWKKPRRRWTTRRP
jgi:methyl-accepting chemotaxis protein